MYYTAFLITKLKSKQFSFYVLQESAAPVELDILEKTLKLVCKNPPYNLEISFLLYCVFLSGSFKCFS